MPYKDGQWQPEDDGVATRIAAITGTDSSMMRQAQGLGMKVANRRGLGNSSMAVGEAEKAVIGAAAPIASQEAQQAYGKNVQLMQNEQQDKIHRENLAAQQQERLAAASVAATGNYSQSISGMLANDKISAADRSRFMESAKSVLSAQLATLERIYGTSLHWGTPATAPAGGTPAASGGGLGMLAPTGRTA